MRIPKICVGHRARMNVHSNGVLIVHREVSRRCGRKLVRVQNPVIYSEFYSALSSSYTERRLLEDQYTSNAPKYNIHYTFVIIAIQDIIVRCEEPFVIHFAFASCHSVLITSAWSSFHFASVPVPASPVEIVSAKSSSFNHHLRVATIRRTTACSRTKARASRSRTTFL